MPEFRRGLGRFLPREAERDLFHPSLEDLRASGMRGMRLRAAAFFLWIDCWRVWWFADAATRVSHGHHPPPKRNYIAMFMQDARRALRLFRMEPGFAAGAVLTLALGIGANTALFAVVEAVLLRPLPVRAADELVILRHRDTNTGVTKEHLAIGDLIDLKARTQTLQHLTEYGTASATMIEGEEPVRVAGLAATPQLLEALEVQPAMGRLIGPDDTRPGAPPVMMISHELWQTRFGSDPNIIGRGVPFTSARRQVIGVLPPGFHFLPNAATDIAVPMTVPATAPAQRRNGWVPAMARLKPGQSLASAVAELDALSREFAEAYPEQNRGTQYYAVSLRDAMVGETKRPLLLLLGAVGFVLLIACVNVGNLLLARSLGRRQEMAVRTALGAGWTRLASQIVTEGLVLAIAGGLAGVALAWQAAPALAALVPATAQAPGLDSVGINVPVMLFSLGVSLLSALLFSAVSCFGLVGAQRRAELVSTRGTSMSGSARRAASWLVAGEIALAGILLVGAGLTLRSFANLLAVDPGFQTSNVLIVDVNIPAARYPQGQAQADLYARAFEAITQVPGVEHAGAGIVIPLTGNNWTVPFEREDRPAAQGERPPDVGWQAASAGYFRALDIPLKAGRHFETRDHAAPKVVPVIISESIARTYFAGEDPIGRRLRGGQGGLEIVGIVGDIRRAALSDRPRADMYFPVSGTNLPFFIRTAGDPLEAVPAVRAALRSIDPGAVVHGARTLEDVASASLAITRLAMRLLAGFAAVALTLAAVGIYGVMAYSVRRRTREIGTRVALGADRGMIIRMVLREGGVITAAGVIVGVTLGLVAARSLSAILYGVPVADPVSLAAAALVLGITGLAACYVPALRAARVDPARTLTTE